jgi:hypothetical protein
MVRATALVPGPGEGHFAVSFLPLLCFVAGADQRENGARHYRNVGAADDFEQAEGVGYFFVAPLVSAHHRNSEDFDLRRLDHHQKRLEIASAGPEQSSLTITLRRGSADARQLASRSRKPRRCDDTWNCSMNHEGHKFREENPHFPGAFTRLLLPIREAIPPPSIFWHRLVKR